MDLKLARKIIIQAIGSDDVLIDLLVLKGGNALDIVHKLNSRASVDIDFSLAGDLENPDEIGKRLLAALTDRFDSAGYVVFDWKFGPRPRRGTEHPKWGGYEAEFKLISKAQSEQVGGAIDELRKLSLPIGDPTSTRKFSIQISKFEWIHGATTESLDGYEFRVYTLPMIAVEKVRAICQQMEGYEPVKTPRPRPRDFFDIFAIIQRHPIDFAKEETHELVRAMFTAKDVPLKFLGRIKDARDFHISDWPAVQASATGRVEPFDYYFDFVVTHVDKLKPLWIE